MEATRPPFDEVHGADVDDLAADLLGGLNGEVLITTVRRRREGEEGDQVLSLLIDIESRLLVESSLIDSSRLGEVDELAKVGETRSQ
jgi:hypothetical protein